MLPPKGAYTKRTKWQFSSVRFSSFMSLCKCVHAFKRSASERTAAISPHITQFRESFSFTTIFSPFVRRFLQKKTQNGKEINDDVNLTKAKLTLHSAN